MRKIKFSLAVVSAATLLVACGGGDDPVVAPSAPAPEEKRAQDSRKFTTDTTVTTFAAMAAVAGDAVDVSTTSRWAGVLNGASYRVEVPADWNGKLVMWAHGFRGSSETTPLRVTDPHIRRYLIQKIGRAHV